MNNTCSKCKWWDKDYFEDDEHSEGWCKRHAPSPVLYGIVQKNEYERDQGEGFSTDSAWWPTTASTDWCGEFE